MSAYRTPAPAPLVVVKVEPRGLVRSNGSACRCRPPGIVWCWWFEVCVGDRWLCDHGGAWERIHEYSRLIFMNFWRPVPSPSEDPKP